MELEYSGINGSKRMLEFWVVVENFVVAVKPWQGSPDVSVCCEQSLKDIPMTICNLEREGSVNSEWIWGTISNLEHQLDRGLDVVSYNI